MIAALQLGCGEGKNGSSYEDTADGGDDVDVLRVLPSATYCAGTGASTTSVAEAFETKVQLSFQEGDYEIVSGEKSEWTEGAEFDPERASPTQVPFEFVYPGWSDEAPAQGDGLAQVFREDGDFLRLALRQPIRFTLPDGAVEPDETLVLDMRGSEPGEIILGDPYDTDTFALSARRLFASCRFDDIAPENRLRWTVELDRGTVTVDFNVGWWPWPPPYPLAVVAISGSFDGEAFEEDSYWSTAYYPATIGGDVLSFGVQLSGSSVCGLSVENLSLNNEDFSTQAWTLDCDLQRDEPVAVESALLSVRP